MASYSKLLTALLRAGLADVGFTKSDGYLFSDTGECVGGLYFQKSRYVAQGKSRAIVARLPNPCSLLYGCVLENPIRRCPDDGDMHHDNTPEHDQER